MSIFDTPLVLKVIRWLRVRFVNLRSSSRALSIFSSSSRAAGSDWPAADWPAADWPAADWVSRSFESISFDSVNSLFFSVSRWESGELVVRSILRDPSRISSCPSEGSVSVFNGLSTPVSKVSSLIFGLLVAVIISSNAFITTVFPSPSGNVVIVLIFSSFSKILVACAEFSSMLLRGSGREYRHFRVIDFGASFSLCCPQKAIRPFRRICTRSPRLAGSLEGNNYLPY